MSVCAATRQSLVGLGRIRLAHVGVPRVFLVRRSSSSSNNNNNSDNSDGSVDGSAAATSSDADGEGADLKEKAPAPGAKDKGKDGSFRAGTEGDAKGRRVFLKKPRNGIPSFLTEVSIKSIIPSPSIDPALAPIRLPRASAAVENPTPHPATVRTLSVALSALLVSNPRQHIPSAASGLIALSCPYRGADILCRTIVEHIVESLFPDALYFHVNPDTLFVRKSTSQTGSFFGSPAIVLEVGSSGNGTMGRSKSGLMGSNLMGSGELTEDVPLLPYPWYQPYMTGTTIKPGVAQSLMVPRIQSEFPRSDFHDLAHKTFESFFEKLHDFAAEHAHNSNKKKAVLPPVVVFFEDLVDLLCPDSGGLYDDHVLDRTELVNSFSYALSKARETAPIVVVTACTPSTRARLVNSASGKGGSNKGNGLAALSSLFKAVRGSDNFGDSSDVSQSNASKKMVRPLEFTSKLDGFVGPVIVPVYPPIHLGAKAMAPFLDQLKRDLKIQIRQMNKREMAAVFRGFRLPKSNELDENDSTLLDNIFASLEHPSQSDSSFNVLDERVLTPNETEQVLLYAIGNSALRNAQSPVEEKRKTVGIQDLEMGFQVLSENTTAQSAISAGTEFAGVFANPADHKSLTKYESEILKNCLIKSSDLRASFNTIGGLEKAKAVIEDVIRLPLLRPDLFSFGVLKQNTTGLLLFGPPGTGKTLLAKAVAAESGANFLNIQMSSIQSKWVGENEKNVKAIFSLARKMKPCVIFVDEIDSLLKGRVRDQPHWVTNTINEWMLEWDGINSKGSDGIIVVGATNRPFDLDEAVLRRLPRRLFINLPDVHERKSILKVILEEEVVGSEGDTRESVVDLVAARTDGYSGSDLKNLCIATALVSVRRTMSIGKGLAESNGNANAGASEGMPGKVLTPPPPQSSRVLERRDFEAALASGDVVPSLNERAELMRELVRWDKEYGMKAADRGAGGWGF
ncbi:hypothetical protein HDU84_005223 [Entophlyctis sp. JEL0112]|nr:hypothetical protein HDU84_005223 [Entophlyctis sp. JEL0112]